MIMMGKANINCQQIATALCEKHNKFITGKKQIELSKYANFCFRLYGEIVALATEYPNVPVFDLIWSAISERFSNIFVFLCNHKTLSEILASFDDYTAQIDAADN